MKLSREVLDKLAKVQKLYKELEVAVESLNVSLLEESDNELVVFNPTGANSDYIMFINLSDRPSINVVEELANEGTIGEKWRDNEKVCYRFSIEDNNNYIMLDDCEEGNEE